ncbi:hypothetical protein C1H46_003504 [Malus baccata]|uniref:Uncharacterized protein n=1 Tax=Malus baccata TaxID=106549 RepID=A0A540NIS0_MALBA|nr:hypothetical protein C1H46_003504 [Malus baccata]
MVPAKEKHNEGNKEPLRAVVQRHFRALVSQLLQGEGVQGEANQFNKKPMKTLMFFRRVLLKGAYVEELKKIKHVVRYAVFAAYHLSLGTSFLPNEGDGGGRQIMVIVVGFPGDGVCRHQRSCIFGFQCCVFFAWVGL